MSPKYTHSWVVVFQYWIRSKGGTSLCPLDILSCYISLMSQLSSLLYLTLPVPSYPLYLSPHSCPPLTHTIISLCPSPSIPSLGLVIYAPTISLTPAPPAVAPPPDIVSVLDEWQYNGRWYYGGGLITSPHPPVPLHSFPRPAVDKSTCP